MAQKVMYPGMVNSPETTITNGINESDTIIYVLDPARVPTPPNLMTLGTGTNAETVKVTEINDSAITVERGFQGIAKSWPAGTVIARNFTEYDYDTLKENIEDLDASKETPAGAQAKADEAEAAAKTYADQEVAGLAGEGRTTETVKGNADALDSHLSDNAPHPDAQVLVAKSTDNATSATSAPLRTSGGLAVGKDIFTGGNEILSGGYYSKHIARVSETISTGKQFRVRMQIHTAHYNYLKLSFSGGRTDDSFFSASRIVAFEATYIVHLYSDLSTLDVITGNFSSVNNNVLEADVSWENVGSNNEVDLIIKNNTASQNGLVGALVIEAVGRVNVVIVDTQVEDIPT